MTFFFFLINSQNWWFFNFFTQVIFSDLVFVFVTFIFSKGISEREFRVLFALALLSLQNSCCSPRQWGFAPGTKRCGTTARRRTRTGQGRPGNILVIVKAHERGTLEGTERTDAIMLSISWVYCCSLWPQFPKWALTQLTNSWWANDWRFMQCLKGAPLCPVTSLSVLSKEPEY